MLKRPYQYLRKTYLAFINSIIFIPSVMAFLSVTFSILMMTFEDSELSNEAKEVLKFALVIGADNARFLLNAFIGGIISLMVFNFSMVMVVLNQAATAFSPRVVPGVLTNKSYQVVLGTYLGTILYCLLLIVNIGKTEEGIYIPQLSIFVGMCLGVLSLILFIYFIHSISRSVQVDNIILLVYNKTFKELKSKEVSKYQDYQTVFDKVASWQTIPSNQSGYFRECNRKKLVKVAKKHDIKLFISLKEGSFLVIGTPLLKVDKEIKQEVMDEILEEFIFYDNEYIQDNYVYGIKQLSEIATKALSPGINDPETAIRTINYMTLLFIEKALREGVYCYTDEDDNTRLWEETYSLYNLMYRYIAPILYYGKDDVMVVERLFSMIESLLLAQRIEGKLDVSKINSLLLEFHKTIKDNTEGEQKNYINKAILRINLLMQKSGFQLPFLE
ncbi:DUF2254 domain-containing protein [Bernardetia sp.]|uniref:DUF2254 domain-containing protein n=1 Tax=Bernardetia sp. TaxID=1937974 RepID=UPI0025C3957D|nr:DUF2254 domain-containing protein [Bernardetia sp.]